MCRLLGIKNYDPAAHRGILDSFLALAEKGNTLAEDAPGHLDGWGIGWYRDGAAVVHKSGGSLLDERDDYYGTLEEIGRTDILIVHLRKSAWKQSSTARHAHPFADRNFLFAHNGTVRDYRKLLQDVPGGETKLAGALDTEVLMHYIIALSQGGMEDGFRKAVSRIHEDNEYSALNSIFSDGNKLFAYRDFRKYPDYYTLYHADLVSSAVVCSEPVSAGVAWRPLGQEELLCL